MNEIKFYEDQNSLLGRKLAELQTQFEKERDSIQKAIKINSYRRKILELESDRKE